MAELTIWVQGDSMPNYDIPQNPHMAHLPPPPTAPQTPTWWTHPPTSAEPVGMHSFVEPAPSLSPVERTRRVEMNVRNFVLSLGVVCLIAAAATFAALHWDSITATAKFAALIGVTLVVVGSAHWMRLRELRGTFTALTWLFMVLCFVDVAAAGNAFGRSLFARVGSEGAAFAALAGALLFVLFIGFDRLGWGTAMRVGAMLSWLLGWFGAFAYWNVTGPDVWILPVAAIVGWLQWTSTSHLENMSSWSRYGLALCLIAIFAVPTALADPQLVRPVLTLLLAFGVLATGLWLRQLAAVWTSGMVITVLAGVQILDVLRDVPGWVAFATVGVALLGIGAAFEYRIRRESDRYDEAPDANAHLALWR